ncbi:MAG: bifunctional serine/threonine-protein kinase/formylglycine-generating enzyme family protein [Candidatus Contendobacter sp.]|nr:bifunctional serine/threonine-protein kinase/formylglycine-generating enzyme family protein [Candidatus Contendobacter sp.]MDG4555977.1 bifunctional serine/threonine-protein kinase/formylglycine-generating enzyme family protein [Candidatus Contendobacter sp.]
MDRATHCPNCFQEPAPAPRCAHCGFDAESYLQTNEILPLFTALVGDKYRVGRVLGQGGFGVVYAGWARRLKRRVAIKEFFPAVENPLAQRQGITVTARPRYQAAFADWKEQFLREAELLAQFSHPRIVQVHDIVEENNTVYLIMERLDGHTLNDHLGGLRERGETLHVERRLSPEDGRRLLHAALEALEELHGHAPPVLHRDLTPHNLFLVGGQIERLKVLDFGLARLGERTQSVVSLVARVGNPGFAAPEQLGLYPGAITPATDFYTLGVTLYTALAGVAPPNAERRCAAQPPQSLAPLPNLDPTLAQVIRACLEISPKQRPQSVADICKRLAAGTIILPMDEPPPPPSQPASLPRPQLQPAPQPQSQPKPAPESTPFQVFRDRLRDWTEGPAMVVIPGGTFLMGSPESEMGRDNDERQHKVTVGSFAIGQYAVTFAEYDRFCDVTRRQKPGDAGWGRGTRPVINVDWYDAMAYTEWLSQQTGQSYRLPTEAEWEYACRGGKVGEIYSGGNDIDQVAWYSGNSGQQTHPVGRKAANGYGLYDMSGNTWEWTCSAYDKGYGGAEMKCAKKDTTSPLAVRGGFWYYGPTRVRSATRDTIHPTDHTYTRGFRLARSL